MPEGCRALGDFHYGYYECDFVSPWTISAQNPAKAREISAWLDAMLDTAQVVEAGGAVLRLWGKLVAHGRSDLLVDALVAATAIHHGLTVATRNVRDFSRFNVRPRSVPRGALVSIWRAVEQARTASFQGQHPLDRGRGAPPRRAGRPRRRAIGSADAPGAPVVAAPLASAWAARARCNRARSNR
ncbi:MAG: hypothetical protein BroJett030_08880 [Alphaproteobacteria bacterium]|nr:MAG: hypothetical protein BroJett030_08880 [Alphaproteobacteria bacterium]